jgi:uncharacterized protein (DUF433 family)
MAQELFSRISIRSDVCFGKPCIRGHRIWVSLILDRLAAGETMAELLQDYPGIEKEDILACIAYGAEMSRNSFADLTLEICHGSMEGVLE